MVEKFNLGEKLVVNSIKAGIGFYKKLGGLEIINENALKDLNSGGFVLSNHVSNLDPPLVAYSMFNKLDLAHRSCAIAKYGFSKLPIFGSSNHVFSVCRSKDLKKLVSSGDVLEEDSKSFQNNWNNSLFEIAKQKIIGGSVLFLCPQGRRVNQDDDVDFKPAAITNWVLGTKKPIVLANVEYSGLKSKVTYFDSFISNSVSEILDISKDFYSNFR